MSNATQARSDCFSAIAASAAERTLFVWRSHKLMRRDEAEQIEVRKI